MVTSEAWRYWMVSSGRRPAPRRADAIAAVEAVEDELARVRRLEPRPHEAGQCA